MKKEKCTYLTSMVCPDCGGRILIYEDKHEVKFCCADCDQEFDYDQIKESSLGKFAVALTDYQAVKMICECKDMDGFIITNNLVLYDWDEKPTLEQLLDLLNQFKGWGIPGWTIKYQSMRISQIAYEKYLLERMKQTRYFLPYLLDSLNKAYLSAGGNISPGDAYRLADTPLPDYGTFLAENYNDKDKMGELLSDSDMQLYLRDVTPLTYPTACRKVSCRECTRCSENIRNGVGFCYYYDNDVHVDRTFDCTHFLNEDESVCDLYYDGDIVLEGVVSAYYGRDVDEIPMKDVIASFMDCDEVKEIVDSDEYDEKLWSVCEM